MLRSRTLLFLIPSFVVLFFSPGQARAANWSQCPDGNAIVRCDTYDCPQGDTNKDGKCTTADQGGKLSDSRKDAFCANPVSGCGEVHYFAKDQASACSVRVKESGDNCDLYNAGRPQFASSTPTSTPKPTASPVSKFQTSTPKPTGSPKPAGSLPKTGPSPIQTMFLVATGFLGISLYAYFKKA
jgi:hypothetical protein